MGITATAMPNHHSFILGSIAATTPRRHSCPPPLCTATTPRHHSRSSPLCTGTTPCLHSWPVPTPLGTTGRHSASHRAIAGHHATITVLSRRTVQPLSPSGPHNCTNTAPRLRTAPYCCVVASCRSRPPLRELKSQGGEVEEKEGKKEQRRTPLPLIPTTARQHLQAIGQAPPSHHPIPSYTARWPLGSLGIVATCSALPTSSTTASALSPLPSPSAAPPHSRMQHRLRPLAWHHRSTLLPHAHLQHRHAPALASSPAQPAPRMIATNHHLPSADYHHRVCSLRTAVIHRPDSASMAAGVTPWCADCPSSLVYTLRASTLSALCQAPGGRRKNVVTVVAVEGVGTQIVDVDCPCVTCQSCCAADCVVCPSLLAILGYPRRMAACWYPQLVCPEQLVLSSGGELGLPHLLARSRAGIMLSCHDCIYSAIN